MRRTRTVTSNDPQRLWCSNNNSLAVGCGACAVREICGGLRSQDTVMSCADYCCGTPAKCDLVCSARRDYIDRVREVEGYDLNDIPFAPAVARDPLPASIPLIFHGSGRNAPLRAPVVALRLRDLFDSKTGDLRFHRRSEVDAVFKIAADSQIVITGVSQDRHIESYWAIRQRMDLPSLIGKLNPILVTSPNYSLFVDTPRTDDMHSMKRIAITWYELAAAGVPTALHINGRTERDWCRWTEFVRAHSEIDVLSYDFSTGAKYSKRARWHVAQLLKLASAVGRNLSLVLRGGGAHRAALQPAFANVTHIDTNAFMKAIKRRVRHIDGNGQRAWVKTATKLGESIDAILQQNLACQ